MLRAEEIEAWVKRTGLFELKQPSQERSRATIFEETPKLSFQQQLPGIEINSHLVKSKLALNESLPQLINPEEMVGHDLFDSPLEVMEGLIF